MELRHLRYFKAIAERLNFSRAAEQLRVGQPALSRQIQDLERELGARLLDRTHTSVQLTDAGRTFYAHACKIVAQVDIATASVQQTLEGQGGELIICNDWRIPNQLVLGAIAEFRARYPQVEVTLRDLRIHEQLTVLRNRQAHLGFLLAREFAVRDSLQSMPLFSSNLMVVVGARHRLAAADSTRMAELADETWLTTSLRESPGWREYITQICRVGGYTPKFAKPVETVEAVLARVATGSWIPTVRPSSCAPSGTRRRPRDCSGNSSACSRASSGRSRRPRGGRRPGARRETAGPAKSDTTAAPLGSSGESPAIRIVSMTRAMTMSLGFSACGPERADGRSASVGEMPDGDAESSPAGKTTRKTGRAVHVSNPCQPTIFPTNT
ncbi:MAG: LysR family transcriptional regulator [Opitutae bacterium]|nr:LysR family transcriptional regulator [Opitutae bacterium]